MTHPEKDPWIGQEFGPYRILSRLGSGGMALVFLAEDRLLGRNVAVKIIPKEKLGDQTREDLFLREARSLGRLNHPNIVTVFAADVARHVPILVLEWMEGGTVQDRLQRDGALHWREATRIIREACLGIAVAHGRGLIHRDLKPSNLLLTREGQVKVGDFGLAKVLELSTSQLSFKGQPVGTPHFMSPEQCRAEPLDARSDIYSLGATYYTLITGETPYASEQAMAILFAHCSSPVPDPSAKVSLPPVCRNIVMRAMAKTPSDRYASATDLLRDLDALLALPAREGEIYIRGPKAPAPMPASRTYAGSTVELDRPVPPTVSRRRWLLWGAASCAGVASLGGAGWLANRLRSGIAKQNSAFVEAIPPQGQMFPMPGRCAGPAFSPDGRFLAVGIVDQPNDRHDQLGVRVLNLQTGQFLDPRWLNLNCTALAFQPAARAPSTLAAGLDHAEAIRLWPVGERDESALQVHAPRTGGNIRCLAFSPDGRQVAAAISPWGNQPTLRVFDLVTRQNLELAGESHVAAAYSTSFSPEGRWLASTGRDGKARIWDMQARQLHRTIDVAGGDISPVVAWLSDDVMAITHLDAIEWHSLADNKRLGSLPMDHRQLTWIAASPDGKRLAGATSDHVHLWDVSNLNQPRETAKWNEQDAWGLSFSADGRLLGAASHLRQLWLWRVV